MRRQSAPVAAALLLLAAALACKLEDPDRHPSPIESSSPSPPAATAVFEPRAAEAPGSETVPVKTRVELYDVLGTSAFAIRADINRKRPLGKDGKRHDALTRWDVEWKYDYGRFLGDCELSNIRVNVTTTYTMPRWRPPPNASPALVKRWNAYARALWKHEREHGRRGVRTAEEIHRMLGSQPSRDSCASLSTRADSLARQVIARHSAEDAAYDVRTNHGASEGARFP